MSSDLLQAATMSGTAYCMRHSSIGTKQNLKDNHAIFVPSNDDNTRLVTGKPRMRILNTTNWSRQQESIDHTWRHDLRKPSLEDSMRDSLPLGTTIQDSLLEMDVENPKPRLGVGNKEALSTPGDMICENRHLKIPCEIRYL